MNGPRKTLAQAAETVAGVASQAGAVAGRLLDPGHVRRLNRLNRTPLPNLFLAGDYVRTDVDLATPTGEGITTPLTFTRYRRVMITGSLRMI